MRILFKSREWRAGPGEGRAAPLKVGRGGTRCWDRARDALVGTARTTRDGIRVTRAIHDMEGLKPKFKRSPSLILSFFFKLSFVARNALVTRETRRCNF